MSADSNSRTASLWHLITEPTPGRLAFATRLSLICALVAVCAELYGTPEIALTVYMAFFLNKPDRTSSMLTTIAFMVIVTLVIGLLLLLAQPVLGSPGLRVFTMAAISFVMLFLASASKLKPLAATIALILAYGLDVLGSTPAGEIATRALLYAWLFVGIPALVSTVVNLLIAPSPRKLAQMEIAERLHNAAESFMDNEGAEGHKAVPLVSIGDDEVQAHLKLAVLEKTTSTEDLATLKGASDCVVTVLSATQLMLEEPQAMPSSPVRRAIASRLLELASIFAAGGYPAKVGPVETDGACTELAGSAVAFFNNGLTQLGELRPDHSPEKPAASPGFFLADAFTNLVHLQFALKVTGAAMLCYLIYSILSWSGIHTALITCFIVSLGTAGDSVAKLSLRILGCMAGAGLGLIVMLRVVPLATGIGGLAVIIFVGAFLGAWIAAGKKQISYAGFQIAFAYFLCVIQGTAPAFDMTVARDRVIGILIGNIVSYFVATQIWPVSVGPRINSALRAVEHNFESVSGDIDRWSRRRLAAETHSMLEGIMSDIHLATHEPASIRPRSNCLAAQQNMVAAARKLEPLLLGIAEVEAEQAQAVSRSSATIEVSNYPNRSTVANPLTSLETLVRTRIIEFQQAVSNLQRVEQDG